MPEELGCAERKDGNYFDSSFPGLQERFSYACRCIMDSFGSSNSVAGRMRY